MKYQTIKFVKALLLSALITIPFTSVKAVVLDTWNDADLQASGDFVTVNTGYTVSTQSVEVCILVCGVAEFDVYSNWFSLQWSAGVNNTLGAIGLDTVFYNSTMDVAEVWEGAIGTGTNVTASWNTNYGGSTAGGGFGSFYSLKNLDGGTTAGISSPLFFVLQDAGGIVSYSPNSQNSTFAAHVRYENGCSGWVSDGNTDNSDVTGNCGSTTTVPEPGSLALLGLGLLGLGFARRKA